MSDDNPFRHKGGRVFCGVSLFLIPYYTVKVAFREFRIVWTERIRETMIKR